MKKIIKFAINQETEKIHEESFAIPHELETLYIEIKRSEECCYSCYMGFILLWDETGAIRLQKLLGYGEQKLAVGLDGMQQKLTLWEAEQHTPTNVIPFPIKKEADSLALQL